MPGVPGLYFHALVGARNHVAGFQATGENRSINRERFGYSAPSMQTFDGGSVIFSRFPVKSDEPLPGVFICDDRHVRITSYTL